MNILLKYPYSHLSVAVLVVVLAFGVTGQWFPLLGLGVYAMREYRDWEKPCPANAPRHFDKQGFWWPAAPMLLWQVALWVTGYHNPLTWFEWINWLVFMAVANVPS